VKIKEMRRSESRKCNKNANDEKQFKTEKKIVSKTNIEI